LVQCRRQHLDFRRVKTLQGRGLRYYLHDLHQASINNIKTSRDGQTELSAYSDMPFILWVLNTGEIMKKFQRQSDQRK
jgi:hypothetical protein